MIFGSFPTTWIFSLGFFFLMSFIFQIQKAWLGIVYEADVLLSVLRIWKEKYDPPLSSHWMKQWIVSWQDIDGLVNNWSVSIEMYYYYCCCCYYHIIHPLCPVSCFCSPDVTHEDGYEYIVHEWMGHISKVLYLQYLRYLPSDIVPSTVSSTVHFSSHSNSNHSSPSSLFLPFFLPLPEKINPTKSILLYHLVPFILQLSSFHFHFYIPFPITLYSIQDYGYGTVLQ